MRRGDRRPTWLSAASHRRDMALADAGQRLPRRAPPLGRAADHPSRRRVARCARRGKRPRRGVARAAGRDRRLAGAPAADPVPRALRRPRPGDDRGGSRYRPRHGCRDAPPCALVAAARTHGGADMSTDLLSAIDALVPAGPEAGRWDDVLARAGVRPSPSRRPRWLALALLAVLIALLATPAFGIQGLVLDLLRKDVSFANSKSAPNEVKKQFADLAIGAPARWAPQVEAAQARVVATFSIAGHPRKLWVAPTRRGGYCYTFERAFGGCRQTTADRAVGVNKIGVTWQGPPPRSTGEFVTRVGGDVTVPAAARITARYADGTTTDIPFVWVSKPIAAGFFTYDVPTAHWSKARRLLSLSLFARDGRRIGRQSFLLRPRPRVVRLPPGRVTGPRERRLPTQPPVAPTPPLQTGSA